MAVVAKRFDVYLINRIPSATQLDLIAAVFGKLA